MKWSMVSMAVKAAIAEVALAAVARGQLAQALAGRWGTPPVGTSGGVSRAGNSAPASALVAGPGKSEQVGEQTGRSPSDLAVSGGVHHG